MLLLFDAVLSSGNTLLEILQICYGHKSGNNRLVFLMQPISERLKLEITTKLRLVKVHKTQQ